MGQICSICGFKEKSQQATANVKTHKSQRPHSSSPLVDMNTNLSNSANVIFFLYTEGAIVPEDVTHLRVDPSVMIIPARAFGGRRQLKVVILPEGLTAIGDGAFNGCTSLDRINFPSTLTDIGDYAFAGCTSLREVKLSNVITIGQGAFNGCHSLERIILPSTLTGIGNEAFYNCASLREVKLFGGILDIGVWAFHGCSSLEMTSFVGNDQIPSKAFVVEKIARGFPIAYRDCRLLTDGTILPTNDGQVVIASECLKYMSVTGLAKVENRINAIIGVRGISAINSVCEKIRALFAYYESLVEASIILELALWKAKVDEVDDLNTREGCRFACGASIIIPIILPFL